MKKIEVDLDIVKIYDLSGYLVLNYINAMVETNKNLGVNYYNGKFWTKQSIADIVKSYNLFTRGKVANAIRKLVDDEILEKRNEKEDNGSWNDNWYTITDKGLNLLNN